jgi:hypothetical protein
MLVQVSLDENSITVHKISNPEALLFTSYSYSKYDKLTANTISSIYMYHILCATIEQMIWSGAVCSFGKSCFPSFLNPDILFRWVLSTGS